MRGIKFNSDGLKECVKCKRTQTKEGFYPSKSYKCGYRPDCIECAKDKSKKYPKTREQSKNTKLKIFFGITLEDYKRMFDAQNGVCKICSRPETVQNRKGIISMLSVDHCHKTGKIRGLLCTRCNNGLGKFEDNEENMLKAVEYLRESKK